MGINLGQTGQLVVRELSDNHSILQKGQKVSLTKAEPSLNQLTVGLGWDISQYKESAAFDLDVAVFLLDKDGKVSSQDDFIFYNNKQHSSGAVDYLGDNRTGDGDGDDEQIKVALTKIPAEVEKVTFTVSIHEAEIRNQVFGQVDNAYIRVIDDKGIELLMYDLDENFTIETGVIVAEIYRHQGEWKFNAIGHGVRGGLEAICKSYGVDV